MGKHFPAHRSGAPRPAHRSDGCGSRSCSVALLTIKGDGGNIGRRLREGGIKVTNLRCSQARELHSGKFNAVIVPGGEADEFKRHLGDSGLAAIRNFVQAGGGYLGICAGAYLGLTWRPNWHWCKLLPEVKVDTHRNGRRGVITPCQLAVTSEGARLSRGAFPSVIRKSYYNNGPVFTAYRNATPLFSFKSETSRAGFRPMRGTPAALAGHCGSGRVILVSPHLEGYPEHGPGLCNFVRWIARA